MIQLKNRNNVGLLLFLQKTPSLHTISIGFYLNFNNFTTNDDL